MNRPRRYGCCKKKTCVLGRTIAPPPQLTLEWVPRALGLSNKLHPRKLTTQNDVCRRYKEDTCPLSSFVPSTIFSIHEVDEIKGSVGLGRTGFRIGRFYSRSLGNRLIYSLLLFLNFLEQHLCKKYTILVYSIDKI